VPRRVGAKMLVYSDGHTLGTVGGGRFEALVIEEALAALAARRSVTHTYSFIPDSEQFESKRHVLNRVRTFGAVCGGQVEVFLEVIMPPDRLLIVGGGHCGRALVQAAALLDFSIILADDRAEYSHHEDYPFSNIEDVLHLSPDFAGLPVPDEATYVVLVSKGFSTDEAALRRVLDTPAAYIGMIGSKRKREVVLNNLRASGIAEEKLARVNAPVGLEIGAETPEEVAVSILAEIIQVRSRARQKSVEKTTRTEE
jgi:xanthine dehydrogenase accessory factor